MSAISKISLINPNSIKRYSLKTTVNGKYKRCADITKISAIGLGVQILRLPSWEIPDVSITALFGAYFIKGIKELFSQRKNLELIKKRALAIKNTSQK